MMEIAFRDLERASRNGLNMEKTKTCQLLPKKAIKYPKFPLQTEIFFVLYASNCMKIYKWLNFFPESHARDLLAKVIFFFLLLISIIITWQVVGRKICHNYGWWGVQIPGRISEFSHQRALSSLEYVSLFLTSIQCKNNHQMIFAMSPYTNFRLH